MSSSMKGGYTEAERMALEWSKLNIKKKREVPMIASTDSEKYMSTNSRDNARYSEQRRNFAPHSNDIGRSYHNDRNRDVSRTDRSREENDRYRDSSRNRRNRDRNDTSVYDRNNNCHGNRSDNDYNRNTIYPTYIDEFGRVRSGAAPTSVNTHSRVSRSRSRSPVIKRREYDDEANNPSSSAVSDSRRREDIDRALRFEWRHDMFNRDESPDRRPRRDEGDLKDYRPPSPTWVSKAGGVAIIRKKASSDPAVHNV